MYTMYTGYLNILRGFQLRRATFNECRKAKTKVITLENHKGHRQSSEPIKTRGNYM